MNRRLIRPTLSEVKDQMGSGEGPRRRKPVPPEQTHAEEYYYVKQMQARTPVAVVLKDGETLYGTIEWYDKNCIKITRTKSPNLLLYKSNIKYIYKVENGDGARETEPEIVHAGRERN